MSQLTSKRRAETASPDGLVLVPVGSGGAWEAVQSLRAEMLRLARKGRPHATFVTAIAEDGREVQATDPDVRVLAMGYRIDAARLRA